MRHNEQQQKLADDARLLRAWRKWHREELETALAGPHGAMIERLMFILNNLARKSAPLLIAYIRGIDWTTIDYPPVSSCCTRSTSRSPDSVSAAACLPLTTECRAIARTYSRLFEPFLIPAEAAPSGAHAG
jgi:hypothetical protein